MAATTSPILTKIQKLLALSNGKGTTEAEASLAAEHVQRLLQDHGLTLAQVEAAGGATDESAQREKTTTENGAMYAWQRSLMAELAQNNFCLHALRDEFIANPNWGSKHKYDRATDTYVRGYISKRHLLVGRSLNVQVTMQMYEYLAKALAGTSPYKHMTADNNRFLEGGVSRLVERLTERRRQREEESVQVATAHAGNGTHTELVLSDVYGTEADLNNDTLNGFPAGTTASQRRAQDARRAEQTAAHDRLVAEGVDTTVAWYRAYGYSEERAVEAAKSFSKTTRRSGGRGRTRNWTRGDDAHYAKINSESYRAGRVAGASIGLDDQVGTARTKRIGKEG